MPPRRLLHVAEKPSVAKELAAILSRNNQAGGRYSTHNGPATYNKIFEFSCPFEGSTCTMLITSVLGHLMETEFDERHRKWGSCDPVELFEAEIHVRVPEDKTDVKRNLEQAARQCEELVLWLDCDREGEAIGFEVMDVCTAVNRRLRVRRARFSALIPRDIERALSSLVPPDEKQAHAVQARSEIDLRLGAAFTRMQTLALQNRFEGITGILSCSPCIALTRTTVAAANLSCATLAAPCYSLVYNAREPVAPLVSDSHC